MFEGRRSSRSAACLLAAALVLGASPARADGTSSGSSEAAESWSVVSFTLGGTALVVGGVAGALAISEKSTLSSVCNAAKHCPTSAQPDVDHVNSDANVATIALAVGAVGVGVGALLLLLRPHPEPHPDVGVDVGPGSLLVRGTF